MRETIYFKDDDRRLSFLHGNYITTTNLTEEDISRITEMHCSPINISVHTTNPELRCKMMKNRFAGGVLDIMRRFADAGIEMNAQIVLCPSITTGRSLIGHCPTLRRYIRRSQVFPLYRSDLRNIAKSCIRCACLPPMSALP